ncbi:MAG: hypothetical protein C0436_00295 [Alphaproteobacteria bacterium]|nr:hypothetical protein [Alphaproteobacteria bacterium]
MIVGTASVDPRRVTEANIVRVSPECWRLDVQLLYGNQVRTLEIFYADEAKAAADLAALDRASYKGPLADAIATDRLDDDDDDDEEGRLGFV